MFETIVALATPPLKSALAIIRCSGDDSFKIVSSCFNKNIEDVNQATIKVGSIMDGDKKIDDVVLSIFKGPKSFTGEDSVEISCHGSMLIVNEIISLLIAHGARMAVNGEFSSRAFIHGKLDLIQAESINDLINATTIESQTICLAALDKKVSNKIIDLKRSLADLISLIAVNIDYPEYEDIEVVNTKKIINVSNILLSNIDALIKDSHKSMLIKSGVNVAIVGKPNVGKSSLLNALIGEDKAIVTDIEGTTRDVVEGECVINGVTFRFFDTAGIRETSNKIEKIGVDKSFKTIKDANIVIYVIDSKIGIQEDDQKLITQIDQSKLILVANKSDIKQSQYKNFINISAIKNDILPLKEKLISYIGIKDGDYKIPALNNSRQIGLLKNARENIANALDLANNNETIDLISYPLISAHNNLLEILGENNQTDLVKEIFSRFCLGK